MTAKGLPGLGLKSHELGANSPLAVAHAINLAERGFKIFPSHGEAAAKGAKEAATSDIEALCDAYRADPSCDYRARCGRDFGLYVLHVPRDRDQQYCEQEFGALVPTWLSTRPSGGTLHWFRASSDDPDLKTIRVRATRAALLSSAPVPGSTHRASQEKYSWVRGCQPGACDLARLPRTWLMRLPRVGDISITANPVLRPEFRDRTGHFPSYWQ